MSAIKHRRHYAADDLLRIAQNRFLTKCASDHGETTLAPQNSIIILHNKSEHKRYKS